MICEECGGRIVAEAIGNYGTVYYLRKNGTIGRKLRTIRYEHSGDWMYYCPECGENYEEEYIKSRTREPNEET